MLEARELELAGVGSLAIASLSGSWTPPTSRRRRRRRRPHGGDATKPLDCRDGALFVRAFASGGDEGDVAAELTRWPWSGVEIVKSDVEYARLGSVSAGEAVVDLDDLAGSLADVGEVDDDASVLFEVFVRALTRDWGRASSRHPEGAPLVSGRPWW